jgi:hypothetical protein
MLSTCGASRPLRRRHSPLLEVVRIMLPADRPETVTGYVTIIKPEAFRNRLLLSFVG